MSTDDMLYPYIHKYSTKLFILASNMDSHSASQDDNPQDDNPQATAIAMDSTEKKCASEEAKGSSGRQDSSLSEQPDNLNDAANITGIL